MATFIDNLTGSSLQQGAVGVAGLAAGMAMKWVGLPFAVERHDEDHPLFESYSRGAPRETQEAIGTDAESSVNVLPYSVIFPSWFAGDWAD